MAFSSLDDERYVSVVTYRRNGVEVATPMWFASADGAIVVGTFPETGKVKRVRGNPRVRVAPCNFRGLVEGPYEEGRARVVTADEAARAREALVDKYGWQWRLFGRQIELFLRIEPV